mgnify:CR=1 FL=1
MKFGSAKNEFAMQAPCIFKKLEFCYIKYGHKLQKLFWTAEC